MVDHTVSITEDKLQSDHTLTNGEIFEARCERGCTIFIDGDELNPYVLDGNEVTLINGGLLFVEKQERHIPNDIGVSAQ